MWTHVSAIHIYVDMSSLLNDEPVNVHIYVDERCMDPHICGYEMPASTYMWIEDTWVHIYVDVRGKLHENVNFLVKITTKSHQKH